jgi:hypothetical protein
MHVHNLLICHSCHRRAESLCTGCKGVYYCTKACQRKDWKTHKSKCQEIAKILKESVIDEDKLWKEMVDTSEAVGCPCHELTIANGSDTRPALGSFQTVQTLSQHFHIHYNFAEDFEEDEDDEDPVETEDDFYCNYELNFVTLSSLYLNLDDPATGDRLSRLLPMTNVKDARSRQAVRQSVLHSLSVLQLSRNHERFNPYDIVPELFMRIDQDQLAYDYIYWYATNVPARDHDTYDWKDKTKPYLSDWNRDRSEEDLVVLLEQSTASDSLHLMHLLILTLIKVKLTFHFFLLRSFYTFLGCVFSDGPNIVCSDASLVVMPVYARRLAGNDRVLHLIKSYLFDPINMPSSQFTIRDPHILLKQCFALMMECEGHNRLIWKALANPLPLLSQNRPASDGYKTHSIEELYYILESTRNNWYRDPRVMKLVFQYLKRRGAELEYEVVFE